MLRVGLTGGLATGKTFVSDALAALGCHVIHADELGHRTLLRDGAAYDEVIREFGRDILGESGAIDRRRLAAIVFTDPERLAGLNKLVHPAVMRMEEEWLARITSIDPLGIAVVEAAILIETGSYQRFDKLIVTVCERAQQIERSMRRGLTHEEAIARLGLQMPLEEQRTFADYIIDTSGSRESTLEQTRAVYDSLRSLTA